MKRLVFGVALSALAFSVEAADNRYSTWSDPNAPQSQSQSSANLDKMIKELQSLVGEAERGRAADPKFLQDLKDLVTRYKGSVPSVQSVLFSDGFSDGNFSANPKWTVVSGKYWIESGYGLRSFVELGGTTTTTQAQPTQKKVSKEEAIIGLLGAVLGGKVKRTEPQQQATTTTTQVDPASIYSIQHISNGFTLKMGLSSWKEGGHLEFGPYQGTNRNTGYRLVYRPAQNPALQLVRHYTSKSTIVGSYASLKIEDQKNHDLVWSRTGTGVMKISLDGKTLIQITDQGFRDDFSGFVMNNKGGDFIMKSISVTGTR